MATKIHDMTTDYRSPEYPSKFKMYTRMDINYKGIVSIIILSINHALSL